ncbi:unnamed protein product [Prunus armeniaca]
MDYLHLKEHDYEVLEDDFDGLACPPLDLEALTIIETLSFDLSHFFDDIDVDEQTHGNFQEEEEAGRSATTETNILW